MTEITNELIAEKVLGWKWHIGRLWHPRQRFDVPAWIPNPEDRYSQIPNPEYVVPGVSYSGSLTFHCLPDCLHDWGDTGKVIEKMLEQGLDLTLVKHTTLVVAMFGYSCGSGATTQEAICDAALEAVNGH